MVEYTRSKITALALNQSDVELVSISPKEGEVIEIQEIAFELPSDGKIEGYLGETKVDEVQGDFIANEDNPIPLSREVVSGQIFKLKGTSATAGNFKYYIKYDLRAA